VDKEIALQNALRYNVHCIRTVINEEMQNKVGLLFSEQNFPQDFFFWGGEKLPLRSPCHDATVSWRGIVTLLPETPGTRVPVQIPDGYPGTKIPESPSTSL